MDDYIVEICIVCNVDKSFDNFNNYYRERKQCNNKRVPKRYYKNKGKHYNNVETNRLVLKICITD